MQILRVSIYYIEAESNQLTFDGEHARVAYYCGRPDLEGLVDVEMARDYHRFIEGKIERRTGREIGDMIVVGKPRDFHNSPKLSINIRQ